MELRFGNNCSHCYHAHLLTTHKVLNSTLVIRRAVPNPRKDRGIIIILSHHGHDGAAAERSELTYETTTLVSPSFGRRCVHGFTQYSAVRCAHPAPATDGCARDKCTATSARTIVAVLTDDAGYLQVSCDCTFIRVVARPVTVTGTSYRFRDFGPDRAVRPRVDGTFLTHVEKKNCSKCLCIYISQLVIEFYYNYICLQKCKNIINRQ